MMRIAAPSMILVAWLVSAPATAQTVKCIDKTGKTTYTNMKCSDLGLKDAGEVPDHLNTNPAYQPGELETRRSAPSQPPAEASKPAPPAEARRPAPAAAAPKQDDDTDPSSKRRCFKTAGGFRCNDVGSEDP